MGLKKSDEILKKVSDDEPIFVLRAQDQLAPQIVRHWAWMAKLNGVNEEKVKDALAFAETMESWQRVTGKKKIPD